MLISLFSISADGSGSMKPNTSPIEMLLWGIALPGFGQLLNGKYLKGIVLIALELLINAGARLNLIIISSFQGQIETAIRQVDYQWLMFYPCVYMFSIWDAFKDAGGGQSRYASLPFVFSALIGAVGIIYSSTLRLFGVLFGPVWLPMLFAFLGLGAGFMLKRGLQTRSARDV
jgi:hypothetical protein